MSHPTRMAMVSEFRQQRDNGESNVPNHGTHWVSEERSAKMGDYMLFLKHRPVTYDWLAHEQAGSATGREG